MLAMIFFFFLPLYFYPATRCIFILPYTEELRDYRNHIHIQYIDKDTRKRQRDFMEEDYSLGTYNKAIKLLHNVPNIIDRLLASCQSFKS